VVIPFLSAAQRRAGRELGSASAVADSKQTSAVDEAKVPAVRATAASTAL
jgi:hypothetical protein